MTLVTFTIHESTMENFTDANRSTKASSINELPVELYMYYVISNLIICIVIIFGNLGTLVCFFKYKKLQQQRYALICSLTVSDLVVGIANGMFILREIFINKEHCMTKWFEEMSSLIRGAVFAISISHLIIIGVDRWIAVMFPLRYAAIVTVKTTTGMTIIAWSLPLINMIGNLINIMMHIDTTCSANMFNSTASLMTILGYLFILLIMISIYGKIWHVAHKQRKRILAQQQMPSSKGTRTNSDANTTVLVILCSYAGLYLPNTFVSVMSMFGQSDNQAMYVVTIIAMGCILANSGVNVFIYALFTNDFKIIFREIFTCRRNKINTTLM